MKRRIWFERSFGLGLPVEALPELLDRLRGTPARLEELVADATPEQMLWGADGGWSAQRNVGHLLDLEPLWAGRVEDLVAGEETLRPADLQNRATDEADHDARPLSDLLAAFRSARVALVGRIEELDGNTVGRTALHPRLRQPMGIADLCFFIAEHDDHHLGTICERLRGD